MKRAKKLPKIVSTASAGSINLEETGSSCHLKLPALQAEKQQAPRTATPAAAKHLPPIDADKGSRHQTTAADRPITRAQSRAQAPHDRVVPLPPLATDQKHAPPEQKLAKEKKPRRDRVGTAKPSRSHAQAAEKPRHLVPISHCERQDMASHVKDTEITNVSPASPYRVDGWSNSPKAPPMVPPLDLSTLNGPIGDAPMSAKRSSRGSSSSPIAASPDKWSNGLTSPEVLISGLGENIHMVGLSPVAEDTGQDTPRPPVSSKRFYHVPRSPADKPEEHIPKPPSSPDKWSNGLTSPEVLIPGLGENIHMVGLSPVAEDTGQDTPRPPVSSKRFYHVPRSPADKPEDHIPKPPSSPDKWSNGLTSPEVLIPGLGENIHMVGLSPVAEDTGQDTPRPPVSSKRFYHVPRSPADKPEDHIPKPPSSPDKWSNGLTSPEVLIPGLRENIHMVGLSPVVEDTGQGTPRPPVSSKRFYHVPRSPADKPEDHIPKPPSSSRSGHISRNTASRMDEHIQGSSDLNSDRHVPHSPEHHTPHPPANRSGRSGEEQPQDRRRRFIRRR